MGCETGKPMEIENTFNILALILDDLSVSSPVPCKSDWEEDKLCTKVLFELDLFLLDGEEPSKGIVQIIEDVFKDDGLLELLNLSTPGVEDVYFITAVETVPSQAPSVSPSGKFFTLTSS